jgi:DNA-binding transcriptional LysR family regulator
MDRLEAMEVFVRIVQAGSFSAVAREMGTTQPTISKQITALETHLGTRLLNRSTRNLSLTEAGTAYYERCKRILEDVKAAEGALGRLQSSLTGVLHVNGAIAMGQIFLTPLVLDFQRMYPELTIELTLNDRYIDLVEEGVDVAVRLGRLADSNLIARPLGQARRVLVATREYLDRFGTPRVPGDLSRHNCLLYAYLSSGNEWWFRGPQGELRVQAHGNFKANNGHAIREALLSGAGVALMPDWLVHAEIESGELVALLPEFAPAPLEVNAVYPSGRHVSTKLRTFLDFLQERFKAIPAFSSEGMSRGRTAPPAAARRALATE